MKTTASFFIHLSCACLVVQGARSAEPSFEDLEKQFRELPMEARRLTGPLFWLHGDKSEEQLQATLNRVAESGNGMFVAESRPHNDWLGKGWYRDLDVCVDFARKNDLKMIIFDDYWWPSQMMGGRVPAEYGSKRLEASAVTVTGPQAVRDGSYADANLVAVIAGKKTADGTVDGASLVNLTKSVKGGTLGWDVPAGDWQIMKFTWKFNGASGSQQRMISVDGADPACVDWFIRTVYQPHYDRYKEDFGKTIVGFFYDEPETQGDWGRDMIALAAERKLDLDRLMVAYKFKLSGEDQATAFYGYLDLFAESWGRTMYGGMSKWCREHGVFSMGHFMEHGNDIFHRGMSGGNMMQLQKYSDMGGVDLVCQQVYPGQRNMGLYQMPKIASSISHTYGKRDDIAFSEVFGAYGQNITYPEMKWLADWHQVRGVNLMNTHSFNPRAPRDLDCPPFFYNGGFEPRYPLYHVWSDYTNRLSLLLSGGHHVCPVAFLHVGQSMHAGKAVRPEEFTSTLQDALFDCDWLLYDAWESDSKPVGRGIRLHKENYQVLVVPPVEMIPYASLAKARRFFEQGGIVVAYDFLPTRSATLGKDSKHIAEACKAIWGDASTGLGACKTNASGGKSYFLPGKASVADVRKALVDDAGIHPALDVIKGDTGNWLHVLHRVKSGRDTFLVCNQDHTGQARPFTFRIKAAGEPECWDAMRNEITAPAYRRVSPNEVEMDITLEPSESVLLVFQKEKRRLPGRIDASIRSVRGPIEVVRTETPPELVIPSTPAMAKDGPSLEGCEWIWFPEDNPAGGMCYFRGVVTLPADRRIADARFVGTCDNTFTLHVNGKEAGRSGDGHEAWRTLTRIDLKGLLAKGRNVFAVTALNQGDQPSPAGLIGACMIRFDDGTALTVPVNGDWKTSRNADVGWLAPGYDDSAWAAARVLGNYGVEPWGKFVGKPAGPLTVSPVTSDPYAGIFEIPSDLDLKKSRVCVEMDGLLPEAAARVTVNGSYAGGFIGKPFRLEVTDHLKPGKNSVIIEPFAPKGIRLTVYPR